jgi:glycerol-3-phosphate cytidylyltransferase-like family protein
MDCIQFVITGVFDSLHKGDSEELTTAENVVLYLPNENGILKASNQLIFNGNVIRHSKNPKKIEVATIHF